MPDSPSPLMSPVDERVFTPGVQAGRFQQPRKILQSKNFHNKAQSTPSVDDNSVSTIAFESPVQDDSSGFALPMFGRDADVQSNLNMDQSRPIVNSPEMVHYNVASDTRSEIVDSGLKQSDGSVTTVETITKVIEERKVSDVPQTGQSTTARAGIQQPRRDSSAFRSQGALSRRPSLYLTESKQSSAPTTSTSVSVETRRFSVPSKASGFMVEDSLIEIQHLHRQETDHMIAIMKARLKEHEEYRLVFEQQFEALRMENERLLRQVSVSTSEITLLKIQLSSYGDGHSAPHIVTDSTVSVTITTVTTTITTTIARIEQWRDEVDRNKGLTISRTDLDRLLSDLTNSSSQMAKLQQHYTELLKQLGSVRGQLQVTLSLHTEKDATIASLTAEVTQLRELEFAKAQQIAALDRDNKKLLDQISVTSSRVAELERNNGTSAADLGSALDQLQAKESLIDTMESKNISLTAEVDRLKQSDTDKARQLVILRQDYEKLQSDSSYQIADLLQRCDALSKERDSLRDELQGNKTLVEEKERMIVGLNAEVDKQRGVNVTVTEHLEAERREKEKLQQDIAVFRSEIASLQERCKVQGERLESLGNDLQTKVALLAEQEHTITSLDTKLDQALRENGLKEGQIATARQEVEQLREKLSVARDEKAELQKRLDAQLIELNNLHNELGRLKVVAAHPGETISDNDVATEIVHELEKKEKQIEELRQELVATTSRYNDLQRSHEEMSRRVSDVSDQLKVMTSQYDGAQDTINSLTTQNHQLKATVSDQTEQLKTAVNRVQVVEVDVSTCKAQLTDLQGRFETQSQQLNSAKTELQTISLSNQEKTHQISTLTAERDQLTSANASKADQISKLLEDLSVSKSQVIGLQDRVRGLSGELALVSEKLQISESSVVEKDRKITILTDEVADLKRTATLNIEAARKEIEDLRLELTTSRSQIAKLEHDYQLQRTDLDSLRNQLEATKLDDVSRISSLKAEVEKWKGLCTTKGDELMAARGDLDRLGHELDISSSRFAESQKELTAVRMDLEQLRRELDTSSSRITQLLQELASLKELNASKTAELTAVRTELEKLRHDLSVSSSELVKYQQKYTRELAELTSQIDQWQHSHAAKEDELAAMRKRLGQLQHDKDESSSQLTEFRHRCETHSAELKFLQEQLLSVPPGEDGDPQFSIETWKTQIMAEVKDYAAVIQLTTTVDKWLHTDTERAEILAAELERRNKENEELRHNLVVLKEIYIRAPRIKQIFQSETVEIKRRDDKEVEALKSALVESQNQLRAVQRVIATADTYADEIIILELKKLNAEVQQNTTYMAEHIAENFQSRTTKVTKEQISAVQKVSESIGKALANSLANMNEGEVGLYLQIALQAYFSYSLRQIISSWTTKKDYNDFISKMYEELQSNETQPMSGRWRALTRAYISPNWTNNLSSVTQQILADLSNMVVAAGCAADATVAKSKLSSFKDKVLSIISIAGQFSEMIGKTVSADFTVIAPPASQMFDEATMEEDVDDYDKEHGNASGTAAGQKVLCSTQLGMTKRMQRDFGKETLTVIKAKVVLESFLDG